MSSKDFDDDDFGRTELDDDAKKIINEKIKNYYGSDVLKKSSENQSHQPQTPKRKHKKIYNALSIACAVVFLTGIAMVFGVVFNMSIPTSSSENSSKVTSSTTTFSSESRSAIESNSSTSSSSSAIENNSATSSSSSVIESNSATSSSSSIIESNSATSSSSSAVENNSSPETKDSLSSYDRVSEFVLPSIPQDGHLDSEATDPDNNSLTNPNDIVTTGDRLFAGIGIMLMVLSLAVATVLNRMKYNNNESED